MITEHFTIKKERYPELKQFIRENMPTVRFLSNPLEIHNKLTIDISYEIDDINKLHTLTNKWHLEDNPPIEPKQSFWDRFKNFIE